MLIRTTGRKKTHVDRIKPYLVLDVPGTAADKVTDTTGNFSKSGSGGVYNSTYGGMNFSRNGGLIKFLRNNTSRTFINTGIFALEYEIMPTSIGDGQHNNGAPTIWSSTNLVQFAAHCWVSDTNGHINFGGTWTDVAIPIGVGATNNVWRTVVMQRRSNGAFELWHNGSLVGQATNANNISMSYLTFGDTAARDAMNGYVRNIKLYEGALRY